MGKQEVFSKVPEMIGSYQLVSPSVNQTCDQNIGVGLFCSVRHNRENIIDSESKLRGLDHILDNWKPPDNVIKSIEPNVEVANNPLDITLKNFEPLGTRDRKSCKSVSEKYFNRFEFPLYSPEAQIEYVRGGLNSRTEAKDTYTEKCKF